MSKVSSALIGIVVIGRNEGERLRRCFESIYFEGYPIVYVDSGSTDHSVHLAHDFGAAIVDLDMSIPFSAARARNAGFEKLAQLMPNIEFVQFIDGDCELHSGWLANASNALVQRPDVAIVAGCLNEKNPSYSIYNCLAELEWNFSGFGEVNAVGGIFMIRWSAFDQVGGFDATIAAGEEPELCNRLQGSGWKIIRIESNMATHDLAMKYFSQWWIRQLRGGYGGMDVVVRFGLSKFKKNMYLARFWSFWLILMIVILFTNLFYDVPNVMNMLSVLFASFWLLQVMRIALREKSRGTRTHVALAYAWFTMVSFWPQMIGQIQYVIDARKNRGMRAIEYKLTASTRMHQDKKCEK